MTLFIFLAIALMVACLAFVLPPLLRSRPRAEVDRASANLGILKDQLAELEREHARGAVSPEHYAETKAELERRVIDEAQAGPPAAGAAQRKGEVVRTPWAARFSAAVVALVVPIGATLIYANFGDLAAFDPLARRSADEPHAMAPEQMDAMIDSLKKRLERDPANADNWATLARTYYSLGRFPQAAEAYAKLVKLVPDDADTLADYADSLAMARGRKLAGEPMELVNRALKLDPNQWKALAMAGTEAFDRDDFKGAAAYWERLLKTLPPESPIAGQIRSSIADARSRGGLPPLAMDAPPAAAGLPKDHPPLTAARTDKEPKAQGEKGKAAAGAATLAGTIELTGDLKAKAAPSDRVFIIARPAEGSRMPLALTSVQVRDLPARFTLDESMAMSPQMTLANVTDVIVSARVSKSGSPMPSSGDLEGTSKPVKVGAKDIVVRIDRVVP